MKQLFGIRRICDANMRILVITRSAWRNDNNTGNTMSNIFANFNNAEIYSMSFRSETPDNGIAKKNFSISEMQFLSYFRKKSEIGIISKEECCTADSVKENHIYSTVKKKNNNFLMFVRELLWSVAPWKNKNLDNYLDEVVPDIVFMPVFGCWYPHKVLKYIKNYTNAAIVLFHADDYYTLKQFSFSPLFWIYRFILRKWIRKSVKISDANYAISEKQRVEYEKIFKKNFKLLFKGHDFCNRNEYSIHNEPLKLLFTGNISSGRYKSLAQIGYALDKINANEKKAELDIYTLTPFNKEMKKMFSSCKSINIKGAVSADEVKKLQKEADILVHVESFDLKNKLSVRLSFSTKIVDYLHQGKSIFAVGPADVASMEYLITNNAAITATSEREIYEKIKTLVEDRNLLKKYSSNAWNCGLKNHKIDVIKKNLYNDFKELLNENSSN